MLGEILSTRSIVICTGTGGVGKTTTAAAMAVEAAHLGRRVVVVTIDPARRLADTLGIALSYEPTPVSGDWPGSLSALMLDTESTFDSLVRLHAADEEQAKAILVNPFYRNIAGSLSGTQEYMAGEKLLELRESGHYDLVIVDTPPTRRALDFLDASRRLTRFLDHRLYRTLVTPGKGYLRALNVAAQTFVRSAGKVLGAEVIDDALAFFAAFDGMESGFRDRASRVQRLFADASTAFVLVASPRADTAAEAAFFAARLSEAGIPVAALVINRMHPRFGTAGLEEARSHVGDPAWANLADLVAVAEGEEAQVDDLLDEIGSVPVTRIPYLDHDVHDLTSLAELGTYLR
jgi:anion-transporting  ArsA/GET3 family ATPase